MLNIWPCGLGVEDDEDDPDRGICSLCNNGQPEDMKRFISSCPILCEFRVANFDSTQLPPDVVINLLNGTDWLATANYCEAA